MNTTGKKYGGRSKGTPNKLSNEIKNKLSNLISEAIGSIDIDSMTQNERLKLIQIGLTYVVPRLKQAEEITNEMPTEFQIKIINKLEKYDDKELDNAIKG